MRTKLFASQHLDDIFVDISTNIGDFDLSSLSLVGSKGRSDEFVETLFPEDVLKLAELAEPWTAQIVREFAGAVRRAEGGTTTEGEIRDAAQHKKAELYRVNVRKVLRSVSARARTYSERLTTLSDSRSSEEDCTTVALDGIKLQQDLRVLCNAPKLRRHIKAPKHGMNNPQSPTRKRPLIMSSAGLLKINAKTHILAGPGSGKTTLPAPFLLDKGSLTK